MKQYCRDSLQTDRGIGRTTKVDFRRRSFEGAGGARIQEAVYSASFLLHPIMLNMIHVKCEKISQFHFTLKQCGV